MAIRPPGAGGSERRRGRADERPSASTPCSSRSQLSRTAPRSSTARRASAAVLGGRRGEGEAGRRSVDRDAAAEKER